MTDKYRQAIVIEGTAKNHVESFISDIHKRADKGRTEFGVSIDVTRVDLDKMDTDAFEE